MNQVVAWLSHRCRWRVLAFHWVAGWWRTRVRSRRIRAEPGPLFGIAYRVLGSPPEAEDIVQEA
jgi:hypothetical protein